MEEGKICRDRQKVYVGRAVKTEMPMDDDDELEFPPMETAISLNKFGLPWFYYNRQI